MPRSRSTKFHPHYFPNAGRLAAKDRARAAELEPSWEDKQEARERYQADVERLRMMARIEPERYLRMVEQGLCDPFYLTDAQAALAKRSQT